MAAGNGDLTGVAQDACGYSPARVPEAMTVGGVVTGARTLNNHLVFTNF